MNRTSEGSSPCFYFRYGPKTCLRRIKGWYWTYPICDAPLSSLARPSFRMFQKSWYNHPSYMWTELSYPVWFSCLCKSYPVWCTSCLTSVSLYPACWFNFGGWFGLALTKLWWTFIISEKYRVFTSTRFSHFTFCYLFIMDLKYFVTSRHQSGALISSMRQILNYLLGKLLQVYCCFKQDKDWNIFRNFRFLDTDLAWVVSLSDLQNNHEARLRPLT